MTIEVIDYSTLYYTAIAKTAVPPVITGKFVQIRNDAALYLVFSPREFTNYHANIVERFCMDKGLEGSYDPERKRYDIYDQTWEILGGGKFEMDTNKKSIKLYDNSKAYGRFEAAGLNEFLNALPEFSGYTISIE